MDQKFAVNRLGRAINNENHYAGYDDDDVVAAPTTSHSTSGSASPADAATAIPVGRSTAYDDNGACESGGRRREGSSCAGATGSVTVYQAHTQSQVSSKTIYPSATRISKFLY